jgi:transposase
MKHNRPRPEPTRRSPTLLTQINVNVAGIDCGAAEHYVAVPPDRDPEAVQHFSTFTADLVRLVDWVIACGVTSVALESTGVYWIPVFELLESRGLEVLLVNARHLKHVPGRKTDVSDCEWLRDLHSVGLLRGSFRPTEGIVALRAYLRHRQTVVESAGIYIQRMQKALVQMNVQLPLVVSDITGLTGMRIVRDIVAGRRDPVQLAEHRDPHCRASKADIIAALTGHYRPEHLFVLEQNLAAYDMCHTQLAACDRAIELQLRTLRATVTAPEGPLPAPRVKRRLSKHEPTFDVRTSLHHLTGGVDLTQIDGLGPYQALKLVSEIGTDMQRWPTEKHFTSWLALAPNNRISGGRLLGSRTPPSANRAAAIFRLAAMSLGRTETALGAFYRRLAARIGKPQAITATARKLAVLVYRVLSGRLVYTDAGAHVYDQQQRTHAVRRLRRRAVDFGFDLVNRATGEVLSATSL